MFAYDLLLVGGSDLSFRTILKLHLTSEHGESHGGGKVVFDPPPVRGIHHTHVHPVRGSVIHLTGIIMSCFVRLSVGSPDSKKPSKSCTFICSRGKFEALRGRKFSRQQYADENKDNHRTENTPLRLHSVRSTQSYTYRVP